MHSQLQLLNLIAVLVARLGNTVEVSAQELVDYEKHSIKSIQTMQGIKLVLYEPGAN